MKKLTALLLSLCMVLTMACATALAEGKTASATAEGFGGGSVTVTLSVDGDKLVNVEIDATSQTDSIGGAAAKVGFQPAIFPFRNTPFAFYALILLYTNDTTVTSK